MDATEAFVLWRGLGIDYEGGVLDHPARVAIHFTHRLGAIAAALMLGFAELRRMASASAHPAYARLARSLGIVLLAQLVLGPLMVLRALPLSLATAHNARRGVAAIAIVRLNRLLRWPRIGAPVAQAFVRPPDSGGRAR